MLRGKGQVGTVWADVGYVDSDTVTYQKMLLSQGWELGIHYSERLTEIPQDRALALMDSEYATIKSLYGTGPTSFCSLGDNDNIQLAICTPISIMECYGETDLRERTLSPM